MPVKFNKNGEKLIHVYPFILKFCILPRTFSTILKRFQVKKNLLLYQGKTYFFQTNRNELFFWFEPTITCGHLKGIDADAVAQSACAVSAPVGSFVALPSGGAVVRTSRSVAPSVRMLLQGWGRFMDNKARGGTLYFDIQTAFFKLAKCLVVIFFFSSNRKKVSIVHDIIKNPSNLTRKSIWNRLWASWNMITYKRGSL